MFLFAYRVCLPRCDNNMKFNFLSSMHYELIGIYQQCDVSICLQGVSSSLQLGYGDLTETPIMDKFYEVGSLDYAVHVKSPADVPSGGKTVKSAKSSLVSTTPKEDAAASSFRLDKTIVVKITTVEDRKDDFRNQQSEDLHDSQEESLPSPTVKHDQQVHF